MPTFISNDKIVAVSQDFIKNHLPGANATFVKVYIYLLMLAQTGESMDFPNIAEILGLLESDLIHAIKYWENQGVIERSGDTFLFNKGTGDVKSQESNDLVSDAPYHKPERAIADIISSDKALSDMFMLSQEILGKTITERDMETIYWFYSDLKMPPEVILLLLEYCVSKGKNRMSYIEKVAVSWNEMGLNTAENVAAYLKGEEKKTGFLYSIRKIMGIADRSLSQIEEKYLVKWHEDLKMSEEMIALAYEYCIIQTAKLSFPYIDKIIVRWAKEGIETVADAEEDNRKFKSRTSKEDTAFSDNKYDHQDLELLTRN